MPSSIPLKFLLLVPLLYPGHCHKIPKCCPLGKLLSGSECISMKSGTALPKILLEDTLVSFKWLKDQKMLRQGSTPRCVRQDQVFPLFRESSGAAVEYFSKDAVFVAESFFFRPGAYCVDGEVEEVVSREGGGGEQPSHIKVVVCGERGESRGGCKDGTHSCYPRCTSHQYCINK